MKTNLALTMTAVITAAAGFTASQSLPQATVAGQVPTIRRQVNLVSVYFTVRDGKHRLVPDLAKEQFRVFEDSREQQVSAFSHHSDVPLNLGILLDTSTRMASLLQAEADAANLFLHRVVRLNDLAFVVGYDSHVRTLQVPTPQVALLEEKVSSITQGALPGPPTPSRPAFSWPMPGTPRGPVPQPNPDLREARLYDAVGISVARYLSQEVGRKAVVVLALADDAKSESSLEDALYTLQQNDVIAYSMCLSSSTALGILAMSCISSAPNAAGG